MNYKPYYQINKGLLLKYLMDTSGVIFENPFYNRIVYFSLLCLYLPEFSLGKIASDEIADFM